MMFIAFLCLFVSTTHFLHGQWAKKEAVVFKHANAIYDRLSRYLERQYIFLSWERFSFAGKTTFCLASLSTVYFEPVSVLLAWGSIVILFRSIVVISEKKRDRRFVSQFHQWLPTFSSMLKSGNSVEKSIELSARTSTPPLSQEFEYILKQTQVGVSLGSALTDLNRRFRDKDIDLCVQTILLSLRTGTSLSEILDTTIALIQKRKKLIDQLDSLTTPSRMQGYIGMVVPVFIFAAIQLFDPAYLDPLKESSEGKKILILGAVCLLLGSLWIKRLSRIEIRW